MLVLTIHQNHGAVLTDAEGNRLGRVCLVRQKGRHSQIGFEFDPSVQINRDAVQSRIELAAAQEEAGA